MGILNVTPDSFSDGGQWFGVESALAHGLEMLDEGADILDVGGESTRPGALRIGPAEEQSRVMPVLRAVLAARPDAVISIDTYHAETARRAVEGGAEIVNDVSGHQWDRGMSSTCAALGCGAVMMHTRGRPEEWRELPGLAPGEVVPMVVGELRARVEAALAAGVKREAMVLDPGFGFGKALAENLPLLAHFDDLQGLGLPLLAGVSRKRFLRQAIDGGHGKAERGAIGRNERQALLDATTAANTAAVLGGAHILRVHDVAPARSAAAVADRILDAVGETLRAAM